MLVNQQPNVELSNTTHQHELTTIYDPLLVSIEGENDNQQSAANAIELTRDPNKSKSSTTGCLRFSKRFHGIFYGLSASFIFTSSNFILKQLDVVLLDIFLFRFLIQVIVSFGFIIYKGYRIFSLDIFRQIFIQSIASAVAMTCFFVSLTLIPLSDLTTIRYTQILWISIISIIVFRERISFPIVLVCLLSFIGIVCVVQPSFLFIRSKQINSETLNHDENRLLGMLTALICAISMAIAIVYNKKLVERKIQQSLIMFYAALTTFLILLAIQIYYWVFSKLNQQKFDIKAIFSTKHYLYGAALVTIQIFSLVLTQKSIKREHPSIVSVVQASDIIFSILLQKLFSTIQSNTLAIIGSTLVLTSIIIIAVHKYRQNREN